MESMDKKEELEQLQVEEQLINFDKLYDLLYFYRLPLILVFLAMFFLGVALVLWRSEKNGAEVQFIESEATLSGRIKADIEGAVVKPGVYELTSGSRIQDLLILAGGLSANADREWVAKNLNQAAKLVDGGKIFIPDNNLTNVTNKTNLTNNASGLVSINTASLSELDTLPGIGPVTAQKIINNRPYQTIEELVSKRAVGSSVFEKIKDKISLY